MHEWRPDHASSYVYLLGIYLGDGWIGRFGRQHQLRVACDAQYEEIIEEIAEAMQRAAPAARVVRRRLTHERRVDVSCYWPHWPEAFPQHGPGRKHARPIVLSGWQQDLTDQHPWHLLRGLLHSDGCRTINRFSTRLPSGRLARYAYPRWFFSNLSADIRGIFCDACDAVGVRWTLSNPRNLSVSHRTSVALLDEHVGLKR